jgi:hypothetical protein
MHPTIPISVPKKMKKKKEKRRRRSDGKQAS